MKADPPDAIVWNDWGRRRKGTVKEPRFPQDAFPGPKRDWRGHFYASAIFSALVHKYGDHHTRIGAGFSFEADSGKIVVKAIDKESTPYLGAGHRKFLDGLNAIKAA
jgi:hypothetical protein